MERSETKWVQRCTPQPLRWVFLNMFLNTVWDFTTCPTFGLHPVPHSFILFMLMLFSLTAWLPLLSACLALSLLFWLLLAPHFAVFVISTFLFLSVQLEHHSHTSLSSPPLQCYFCWLCSSLWKKKTIVRSEGVCQKHTSNLLKLYCYWRLFK